MKAKAAKPAQLDLLGNGRWLSDREILATVLKGWRQKLSYCSIFAAVPALLASHISEARSDETKKPEATVAERTARRLNRLKLSLSNPALLKRQSAFRLPHQKSDSDTMFPLGGNDDCPGRAIPGGTYTAFAPFTDSGNTAGANDTITGLHSFYYYYYNYTAHGPDQIYSFTLTGRGPNPQIQVSASSGTYRPLIYVLQGAPGGVCPAGTGNLPAGWAFMDDSRWRAGSNTATLEGDFMKFLPLNVPLHLFIDSAYNDPSGSGAYTVRMQDVSIASATPNAIDGSEFFVRQHYLDFLNRQPDDPGLNYWTSKITGCGNDSGCIDAQRVNVSAAYFLSIEFQQTGYLVYKTYKASYGNLPNTPVPLKLNEFLPDTQQISAGLIVNQGDWQQVLENNKQNYFSGFVQRARFASGFPMSWTPEQFVDQLFFNAGVTPSSADRAAAINEFGGFSSTTDIAARARVLRRVAENSTLAQQEFNRAFVLMQYFGYLRRNPNDSPDTNFDGYNFWLSKLDQFNGNYIDADMVKAFIVSGEYRSRF